MTLRSTVVLFALTFGSCLSVAQNCSMPQLPPASSDVNMFTPEQAQMLGDIVAEHLISEFKLVNDPAINKHLQDIADRMAALSNAGKVRVELFDIPDLNAFTYPGGRILVSRKLVAYAKSEDELAGVLAHEFGHVLTHDAERDMSTMLRKVLGVSSVGDRRDIEEKYNRLIENERRKSIKMPRGESEQEQQIADQYAIWLMARAGYDPQAYTQLWDRWNELKSHTGSWLSDVFGSTKPEQKRLRIALKALGTIPPVCIGQRTVTDAEFNAWQQSVVEASRATRTAALHDVVSEKKLDPALRTDISQLRFSPDGKWFFAQDDASIFVFTREPMEFKFRIDASDARPADFTTDSQSIVFYDTNYRVERWNLASQKREWVHEVAMNKGCMNTRLSRDGVYLACATSDSELRIWDVASSTVVFEKKNFYYGSPLDSLLLLLAMFSEHEGELPFFHLAFSPDSHYLICSRFNSYVAVDLTRKAAISLPGSIRDRIWTSFAFLSNDRLVGIHNSNPNESAILAFPSGEVISKVRVGRGQFSPAAHGADRLILKPITHYALGVVDVQQNKVVLASRVTALDIYDDYFINEQRDGEIGLYRFGTEKAIQTIHVPTGPLGTLRAADVSDDFTLLAISQRSRGAVWDLKSGERKFFVTGFRSAYIAPDSTALLDFPEYENTSRMIVRADATRTLMVPAVAFGDVKKSEGEVKRDESADVKTRVNDRGVYQFGKVLIGWRDSTKRDEQELVARDSLTARELWSRKFNKSWPAIYGADSHQDTLVLEWSVEEQGARKIIDANPALKAQLHDMSAKKYTVELLEILDRNTGTTRGSVLVDSGGNSFRIKRVQASHDIVVVGDNRNRTVVYSLSSGKEIGHAFGLPVRLSQDASVLFVENNPGQVTLYSLPSMGKKDELTFPSGIAFARFADDTKRLFVLTKDHTAYSLKLETNEQEKVAAAAK